MKIARIGDALGAEISGVDLSRPIEADVFSTIRQAWLQHLVLRFRRQLLTDAQLKAFS